ncbi:MAG: hypothetical protein ACI88C_000751 [Acidimicrobiales bacterium]|jgi:hypothetical protein
MIDGNVGWSGNWTLAEPGLRVEVMEVVLALASNIATVNSDDGSGSNY